MACFSDRVLSDTSLTRTDLVLIAFVDDHPMASNEQIAGAIRVSVRSVQRSLAKPCRWPAVCALALLIPCHERLPSVRSKACREGSTPMCPARRLA